MTNMIIPFGKYKGQPIETLIDDQSYLEWCMGNNNLRAQHPQFFSIIINNFSIPSDTPEHNRMQGEFLDTSFCVKFAQKIYPDFFKNKPLHIIKVSDLKFEHAGIDVSYNCQHQMLGMTPALRIEIKPSVGDDYPTVLRQMHSNKSNILYLKEYTGSGLSRAEFIKMFESQQINILFEKDLKTDTQNLLIQKINNMKKVTLTNDSDFIENFKEPTTIYRNYQEILSELDKHLKENGKEETIQIAYKCRPEFNEGYCIFDFSHESDTELFYTYTGTVS